MPFHRNWPRFGLSLPLSLCCCRNLCFVERLLPRLQWGEVRIVDSLERRVELAAVGSSMQACLVYMSVHCWIACFREQRGHGSAHAESFPKGDWQWWWALVRFVFFSVVLVALRITGNCGGGVYLCVA